MDPVIHLSERHRSDMLLDLSGEIREERVVVQVSISDERDFDRVAEALIIQQLRIHLLRVKDERRAKAKTDSNVLTIQTLPLVSRKKARANTPAAENLEREPHLR